MTNDYHLLTAAILIVLVGLTCSSVAAQQPVPYEVTESEMETSASDDPLVQPDAFASASLNLIPKLPTPGGYHPGRHRPDSMIDAPQVERSEKTVCLTSPEILHDALIFEESALERCGVSAKYPRQLIRSSSRFVVNSILFPASLFRLSKSGD